MNKKWTEKLENCKPHSLKKLQKNFVGMKSGQLMLLPSPALVDDYIKAIPERESPVAEAAYEALSDSGDIATITPIWRLLSAETTTLKKVSFDHTFVTAQREVEGIVD